MIYLLGLKEDSSKLGRKLFPFDIWILLLQKEGRSEYHSPVCWDIDLLGCQGQFSFFKF